MKVIFPEKSGTPAHPTLSTTRPPPRHFKTRSTGPLPPLPLREGYLPLLHSTGSATYSPELTGGFLFFGRTRNQKKGRGSYPSRVMGGGEGFLSRRGGPWRRFRAGTLGGVGPPPPNPVTYNSGSVAAAQTAPLRRIVPQFFSCLISDEIWQIQTDLSRHTQES